MATPHQLRHYGHQILELAASVGVDDDTLPHIQDLETLGIDLLRKASRIEASTLTQAPGNQWWQWGQWQ